MMECDGRAIVDVRNRKQLFIDRRFIAEAEGVDLAAHRPTLAGVALEPGPEGSWDDGWLQWATVIEEDGLCKMWLIGRSAKVWADKSGSGGDASIPLGYAASADGVHWEKPDLGLFEWNGSKRNNIVCMDWGTVTLDPTCDPSQRYKLLVTGHHALGFRTVYDDFDPERGGMYLYTSEDGIHWRWHPSRLLPYVPDTFNQLMYDTRIKKYVAYLRVWPQAWPRKHCYGRAVGRVETGDPLKPWPFVKSANPFHPWGPKNIATLSTEIPTVMSYPGYDQADQWTDIYEPEVVQYPWAADAYFAFPALNHFRADPDIRNYSHLEVGMCVSRDGIEWDWPSLEAYIPLEELGSGRGGMLFSLCGMIRRGGRIYQYHSATDVEHRAGIGKTYGYEGLLNSGRIYRTVQRLDGFVSASFSPKGGELLTPVITFEGTRLELNLDAGRGAGRVEICDEGGTPVPGFAMADANEIHDDSVEHEVRWKAGPDVTRLQDRPIRLRFRMCNVKLYAFQFC